jgi:hypothetical protein
MYNLKQRYIRLFLLTSCVMFIFSLRSLGQEILLEQDVNKDTIIPKRGPNYRHFNHVFIGYGLVAGNGNAGAEIKTGLSRQFFFGSRYKLKINSFYAIGLDGTLGFSNFSLKQNNTKILPNKSLHDKESMHFTSLSTGFYNRFNFGKRGNSLGNYLDIGVYGEWLAGASHRYTDTYNYANNSFAKRTSIKNTRLQYVEPFQYGFNARFGLGRIMFFGQYRMTKLFKNSFQYPDLPKVIVGLQIGLYS